MQHTIDTLAASLSAIDLAEFVRVLIGLTVHIIVDAVAHFFFTWVNRGTAIFEHPVHAQLHTGLSADGRAWEGYVFICQKVTVVVETIARLHGNCSTSTGGIAPFDTPFDPFAAFSVAWTLLESFVDSSIAVIVLGIAHFFLGSIKDILKLLKKFLLVRTSHPRRLSATCLSDRIVAVCVGVGAKPDYKSLNILVE